MDGTFKNPVTIGLLGQLTGVPIIRGVPGTGIFWGVPGGQAWTPAAPQDVNAPQGTGHSLGRP